MSWFLPKSCEMYQYRYMWSWKKLQNYHPFIVADAKVILHVLYSSKMIKSLCCVFYPRQTEVLKYCQDSQKGRPSAGLLLAPIAASYLSILSMTQGVTGFGTRCDKFWYKEWQNLVQGVKKSETMCNKVWYKVLKSLKQYVTKSGTRCEKSAVQVRVWYKV